MRQAPVGWPTGPREKKDVAAKLAELDIDGTVRSEALDLEQHLRLAAAFVNEALGKPTQVTSVLLGAP